MKRVDWFPFERNRYYYGKLLSVNDFELEQGYMNNKRKFINRILYGMGVISGFNVAAVDKEKISVEAGAAIDYAGREIIVDMPVTKRLRDIDGFADLKDESTVYLCLAYDEKESEPVYGITGQSEENEKNVQYNKYIESYRLYLKAEKPDVNKDQIRKYYTSEKLIYSNGGIEIFITVPKFVKSGEPFEITLKINKGRITDSLNFSFDVELSGLISGDKNRLSVKFDEKTYRQQDEYTVTYFVDAMDINNDYGYLSIAENSFTVKLNGYNEKIDTDYNDRIYIIKTDISDAVRKHFYKNYIDDTFKSVKNQPDLCIARIEGIRSVSTYIIENVVNMPFDQYIFNSQLSEMFFDLGRKHETGIHDKINCDTVNRNQSQYKLNQEYCISSGTEIISLGFNGKYNQAFFSRPIVHGLGLGAVNISLGIAAQTDEDSEIIYGSSEVFSSDSNKNTVRAETAAKLNPADGTFIIGIRLLDTTVISEVKIHWTAIKKNIDEADSQSREKRIFIEPDVADINVRRSCHFRARLENISEPGVIWETDENSGGMINSNGMYTAPNTPGIYTVRASSEAYPSVTASIFVVVREEG